MTPFQSVAKFRLPERTRRSINTLNRLRDNGIHSEPVYKANYYIAVTAIGIALVWPVSARWACKGKTGHGINALLLFIRDSQNAG